MKTKALRLYGAKDLRTEEFELPEITDDEILAEAMLRVLEDPALSARLKAAARKRAEDFSCESYRAHLMKILEEPVKGSCE